MNCLQVWGCATRVVEDQCPGTSDTRSCPPGGRTSWKRLVSGRGPYRSRVPRQTGLRGSTLDQKLRVPSETWCKAPSPPRLIETSPSVPHCAGEDLVAGAVETTSGGPTAPGVATGGEGNEEGWVRGDVPSDRRTCLAVHPRPPLYGPGPEDPEWTGHTDVMVEASGGPTHVERTPGGVRSLRPEGRVDHKVSPRPFPTGGEEDRVPSEPDRSTPTLRLVPLERKGLPVSDRTHPLAGNQIWED